MNLENIEKIISNEPKFRQKQVFQAIFRELIDDWSKATTFPLKLREKLNSECSLAIDGDISKVKNQKNDQTIKALLTLKDGKKIETVLLGHQDGRFTVCVSTQVGCPLGCSFCATGKMGFLRDLTVDEILSQVMFFARYLKASGEDKKITNIVYMGMGEPFLNYENVIESIKILNNKDGFNLGSRKFSISTSGIIDGIKKLASEKMQINLAISLHASNNELRSALMPVSRKYSLDKVLSSVNDYITRTSRRVMFEYLLIRGVNDSEAHAHELVQLMKKPLYFVNLIPYNPTGGYKRSDRETVMRFKEILEENGITVTQRYNFGLDLNAACGQLATKNK